MTTNAADKSWSCLIETINPIIQTMRQLIEQQQKIVKLFEEIPHKKQANESSEGHASSEGSATETEEELAEETRIRQLKLYRAALTGDWDVAKRIYNDCEEDFPVEISTNGNTVLHIATARGSIDFVKELVKKMNADDLAKKNKIGSTALYFAATSGMVELAKELMKKNKKIAMEEDKQHTLPIEMAAWLGHKDMVEYLYKETKHDLKVEDLNDIFVSAIESDLYDVALQMLDDYPDLAFARARNTDNTKGFTALHVLARKHTMVSKLDNQNQRGIIKRCFNLGSGDKDVEKEKLRALQLVKRIWKKVVLLKHSKIKALIKEPCPLILDAAKRGNIEFLSILIDGYPDLIWMNDNMYSIFHFAVMNRQMEVFKLINEIGAIKEILLMWEVEEGNNILHLAGRLPPKDRLNVVSGAALQMQNELLWFKEVQKVVQPKFLEARNKAGLTPRELFTKEHEDLRAKGEQWMHDTAQACMVVAALIATVAFTATFTVPGGNEDTGFPIFLENVSFTIFIIADAISLVSSSVSILNFLSILTSRYTEEDFIWLLPRKLRFGMLTLFISIVTMMAMFSSTFFIIFKDKRLWIAILVTAIASIPVIMFIRGNVQLVWDALRLSYSGSLVQHDKYVLFRKGGEQGDQRQKSKTLNLRSNLNCQCTCSTNV